jgi:rhodanese-related sulfurtransferase
MSTTKPIIEGDENAAIDRVASRVLEFGCAEPPEMAAAMLVNLRLHTDAWDLAEDLTRDETSIVVLDVRPKKAYEEAHIPGARSFPHREMTESSTRTLDRSKVYVVYCDGIGCNGSTKGAYKLSSLGFKTKELLGGLDWWRRDGHAVLSGPAPGDIHQAKATTLMRPVFRYRGFRRMTISTSWSTRQEAYQLFDRETCQLVVLERRQFWLCDAQHLGSIGP